MSTQLCNIVLRHGLLGVTLGQSDDGACIVSSKFNEDSPLEVGDVILCLNGMHLEAVADCGFSWERLFHAYPGDHALVVRRQASGSPTASNPMIAPVCTEEITLHSSKGTKTPGVDQNATTSSTIRVAKYRPAAERTSQVEKNRIYQNERRKKLRNKRQYLKRQIAYYKNLLNIKDPPKATRKERTKHLPPKEELKHMTMEEVARWKTRSWGRLKDKRKKEEMASMEKELIMLEEMAFCMGEDIKGAREEAERWHLCPSHTVTPVSQDIARTEEGHANRANLLSLDRFPTGEELDVEGVKKLFQEVGCNDDGVLLTGFQFESL